ncbi:MAG: hexitol phosphatase HxpB [Flavobacteriales bacterium]|jgi:mannitol-1-/sugar-/sorbitol-6-/2-deoxyglucose-6-phosphatase
MIKAILFDMDGVLIDSEPLWKKAIQKVMKDYGFDFSYDMCNETKGMRVDEVTHYWKQKLNASFESKKAAAEIIEQVISLIKKEGKPMEGVLDAIEEAKSKNIKLGLASSSSMKIIETVLEKLNIKSYFEAIHSAEHEEFGKPHPQVFISAAQSLGTLPENCLVIEDSLNGVIAAKAAKMKVIAIPETQEFELPQFSIADDVLKSMKNLTLD